MLTSTSQRGKSRKPPTLFTGYNDDNDIDDNINNDDQPPSFTLLICIWSFIFSCHLTALQVHLSLTDSLTPYKSLLKNTTTEHSERLVTLETCYQSDEET